MDKKYKSEIMEAIHEDALGLFEAGAISEEEMREFDRDCLARDETVKPKAVRVKRAAVLVN
jgi:putative transcriptional regulator